MNYRILTLLGFIFILGLIIPINTAYSVSTPVQIEELEFFPDNIFSQSQDEDDLIFAPGGLTLNNDLYQAEYTSPVISAPIAFNALVPEWTAELPPSSDIEISIRTGKAPTKWGEWKIVEPSADWTLPEDHKLIGDMLVVPIQDQTHNVVQYKITIKRSELTALPLFKNLKLIFIDSTQGPSVSEMIAQQKQMDADQKRDRRTALDQYPKPFVISRAVWCTDPRCNYSDGLEYESVTHLILHHTVSGSSGDSAAIVRAIWAYHTITRGWGDIGYNFLTDTDGVLFEGHLGGDDVVGIHSRNANSGSMALALIGSYSVVEPPPAMIESAVDLFAWKADQKDIDVFDASNTLPNVPYGLPNLMGHRDVEGTTECPGDDAHALLPAIRIDVAARIGLTSPYIYVDELSSAFNKSNASWHVASLQCGYNTHAWFTWSTTNPTSSTNWGEWRPNVPIDGRYRIDAYIPYCNTGAKETGGAYYQIQYANGSTAVTADQNTNVGLWMNLGEFDLRAGTGNVIRLTDLTAIDSGLGVWFDALRLLKLETIPSALPKKPADGSWFTQRDLLFEWTIEHPEQVASTKFETATDEQFQNIINTQEWPSAVESVMQTFNLDYAALYWRIILTTKSGSSYATNPQRFGIDTQAPTSRVNTPVWLDWSKQYLISWQGEDQISGVAHYTIEYMHTDGSGNIWQTWITNTAQTSSVFVPPEPNGKYAFRSQAEDTLGNKEAVHPTADTSSEEALSLSHAIILPVIIAD